MAVASGVAETSETRLYYEVAGGGPAVVFICGGGMLDRRMWDAQVDSFAARYRVIRYDLRGLGKSEVPSGSFSHVEDLRALLKSVDVSRAILVGLSLGAAIAIDFTLEYPAMVGALILASPGVGGYEFSAEYLQGITELFTTAQKEGASQAIEIMMGDDSFTPSQRHAAARAKVQKILSDNAHVFRDFAFVSLMEPLDPPAIERLSEIDVPALVVAGDRDQPEHLAIVELLMAKLRGAEKVVVTESGHLVNMERPEEFNRHSLEFLNRL